ncbi:prophage tail fiber N-terminal domain-containing protein, partial [Halomonas sp. Mc5H-6]|uniref:prophage tail fiber N-terminal domain-containing protein n=1 Tax=Halomonas sp. Mc5H-6 TaxID=2954500 RepID=UPI0020985C79
MPLSLSGRLTTPFGDPLPNAVIRFDAVRTSGAVLSYTNAQAITDNSGDYAISVEYGTYDIRVKTSQSYYTLATGVLINADNTEADINALVVSSIGYDNLTPQIILEFQQLRDEALAAEASASAHAEQTTLDRTATGEDAAATAADRVATGQDKAATAADRIATGEDRVATGEDAAATAADRVATAEDALEAKHWANYPIDSPVPEGDGTELSAMHWAEISRQRAVNAMVAQGAWDASTGTLPSEPAGASYWLVTGAADGVTIGGVEYRNKDMLLWTPADGGGGTWSKIDNTDSVASVAGKTGAVQLTPGDVGADPAGTASAAVTAHEEKASAHTPAQVGADPAGTASAAVTAHEEKASAHTPAQVGADPAGTASAAVTA